MSYTILYKRLFVRLSDGTFIPFTQAGSSNVFDTLDPRRRSRSWEGLHCVNGRTRPTLSYSRNEIESYLGVQKRRAQDRAIADLQNQGLIAPTCQNPAATDWRRHFGWYISVALGGRFPRDTAWPSYSNFFLRGMDKAVDFDTFLKLAGALKVTWWEGHDHRCTTGITNEETLRRAFNEAMSYSSDSVAWVEPVRDGYLESAADALFVSATKGYIVQASTPGRSLGWIASLFPLSFSEDKDEAAIFPKSAIEGPNGHLCSVLRAFCPEVQYICFHPTA